MKRMIALFLALGVTIGMAACRHEEPLENTTEATVPATSTLTEEPIQNDTLPVEIPSTEAPSSPPTETTQTLPPIPSEPDLTLATLPTVTEPPIPVLPPVTEATICNHLYQPAAGQAPSCIDAGYENYICGKCGALDQQLLQPLGHHFREADCLHGQVCNRCGVTWGQPLGHLYMDGNCSRCGEPDPSVRQISIMVKDNKNTPIPGVTVELYTTEDQPAGICVSDDTGMLHFTLRDHPGKYRLVLTQIPQGYTARQNSYEYGSDSGAIVLDLIPVIDPEDHSKAAYKVGSFMGDFTLTDVDGTVHSLSQLLETKQLVMLNFWYCSCVPCKEEFPYFNTIFQRYGDEVQLLALNHFDSEDQIRQLRDEMGLSFPVMTEDLGMQQGFQISSYPITVFIGNDGRILMIQRNAPFESEEALDTIIRQLLGK